MSAGAFSSIASLGSALFNKQKAPTTVPYVPVDLQQTQQQSITGNAAAEGSIEDLLSKANSYTQNQADSLLEKAVPGYHAFATNLLQAGADKLANPYALPQDVTDKLNQVAAEKGISRGTAGQTNQYSALKDLGVNMLDYGNQNFQQAIQALSTVTGLAPRISPLSPMSFYVTPQQQAQNQTYTNTTQQQIAQGGANAATAARNWNTNNLWDSLHTSAAEADTSVQDFFKFMGSSMFGGMGGAGAGGGG